MDKQKLEQEINVIHERICSALGDPKRILILYLLAEQGHCVNEICEALDLPQSTVSRHLRVLRERGLVLTERQGTSIHYSLADERIIAALDLMRGILASQWEAQADLAQSLNLFE
ncbi:MAG: metalloregulator ArsR/SmtB family transcription factor [Anaerolineaceae bacterium]|jgi:ArsR family transcriptional regulator|nr:metalloregulator ArsR/SmtB family transcription factor [Anaerolineaceae bacterium]